MLTFPRASHGAALALLTLAPTLAQARDYQAGDLLIQHPWARATPGGAEVAGGYLTVVNQGAAADTLTGGSFAASTGFEVHTMTMADGVMTMRPSGSLAIPPGGSLALSPAGMHVMFTGLKRPLRKGEEVDGTLTFARAGTVPVRFEVEAVGAREPAAHAAHTTPGMDTK